MKKLKYKILFALFSISLIASLLLTINLVKPTPAICGINEGCSVVASSIYSETLGMSNEFLGLAFFVLMAILIGIQLKKPNKKLDKIIAVGVVIGFAWAMYSLYLMTFVIKAFCKYCTIIDISLILSLLTALYSKYKK